MPIGRGRQTRVLKEPMLSYSPHTKPPSRSQFLLATGSGKAGAESTADAASSEDGQERSEGEAGDSKGHC